MNEENEVPATLEENYVPPTTELLPSPDQVMQDQINLKEAALAKLVKIGLTEDEAKAIAGL